MNRRILKRIFIFSSLFVTKIAFAIGVTSTSGKYDNWGESKSTTQKAIKFSLQTNNFPNVVDPIPLTSSSLFGLELDLAQVTNEGSFSYAVKGGAWYAPREDYTYHSVKDLYLGYKTSKMAGTSLVIGRQYRVWNEADTYWRRGLFQPRNFYSSVSPAEQGLTGVFVDLFQNKKFPVTVFASPLFIPDFTVPIKEVGGGLISPNPNFVEPSRSISISQDQSIAINYALADFSYSDIILNPSLAFQVSPSWGNWQGQLSYAYKPMNQIALHAPLKVQTTPGKDEAFIFADVTPEAYYHTLTTLALSYEGRAHWRFGIDVAIDRPNIKEKETTTLQKNVADTEIYTVFAKGKNKLLGTETLFSYSYLSGGDIADTGELASVNNTRFPMRFQFTSSAKLGFIKKAIFTEALNMSTEIIYDFEESVAISEIGAQYQWGPDLTLSLNYTDISLFSQNFKNDELEKYWHSLVNTDSLNFGATYAF